MTTHAITDADLAFAERFLSEFLKGQPAGGPFSFIAEVKPARVTMDAENDAIELGEYAIQVQAHPTRRLGFGPEQRPAPQYEVTLTVGAISTDRDEPDDVDVTTLGASDDLVGALMLVLGSEIRTHANAMLDGWRFDELVAAEPWQGDDGYAAFMSASGPDTPVNVYSREFDRQIEDAAGYGA
jgi:hypothetical protein